MPGKPAVSTPALGGVSLGRGFCRKGPGFCGAFLSHSLTGAAASALPKTRSKPSQTPPMPANRSADLSWPNAATWSYSVAKTGIQGARARQARTERAQHVMLENHTLLWKADAQNSASVAGARF